MKSSSANAKDKINDKKLCNVIAVGDSFNDRKSIQDAAIQFRGALFCKSIKFHEQCDVARLENQIALVVKCFDYIYNHSDDLDLQMTIIETK